MNTFLKVLRTMSTRTQIRSTLQSFTPIERILFILISGFLFATAAILLITIYKTFTIVTPSHRGTFTEAMVGVPRLVQPLFATSQTDKDLVELLFAGLLTYDSAGNLVPELAQSYEVSEDALEYTFTLKENLTFHDGTPLTADDVVYTIRSVQDPLTKSPLRTNWDGIGIDKIDARSIVFTLPNPYAGFLHNATLGIIPKHLWDPIAYEHLLFTELNTHPVGSGPYRTSSIKDARDDSSPIVYTLKSFDEYALGVPYITTLEAVVFPRVEVLLASLQEYTPDALFGLTKKDIDSWTDMNFQVSSGPLPRSFGLFFNAQQHPELQEKNIRNSIAHSIDRDAILSETFGAYADVSTTPFPWTIEQHLDTSSVESYDPVAASSLLKKEGYILDPETGIHQKSEDSSTTLTFNLVTSDTPIMIELGAEIARQLHQSGIDIEVVHAPIGELVQSIIPRREFDILLFGQAFTHDTNIFAYWHSSQRNDPGLNITSYANATTDRYISEALQENDIEKRYELYSKFSTIINKETPALFLFSPRFTYLTNTEVIRPALRSISAPHYRFADIHTWYRHTHRILPVFASEEQN